MQPVIVMGDKTSHGGTVITCSSMSDTHGKGWARVGDKVACPRCKGIFPIAEGDSTLTDDGLPVAYHGCKVACGASLISGQLSTFTNQAKSAGSASGSDADSRLSEKFGFIGAGIAGAYEDEPLDSAGQRFRGRFQLLDASTGEPISGQAARLRTTSGQVISTTTDSDGFTQWVEREARETLAFDLNDEEDK
ncbi:PAAR domain-containing protein [Pseudoduganella flava]|uniref:PAAR domain-containing protein n=1 Tax=Pseudoduganella flava TaxID=871742 RepID=A0ABX6FVG6_9BURK|nr:PAAR domain-containing protein [Pseudoduganella flava]QGZ41519.1 PAAR domain-containing protein [Pseudoduganella flava]